jgi:hypothetical protein
VPTSREFVPFGSRNPSTTPLNHLRIGAIDVKLPAFSAFSLLLMPVSAHLQRHWNPCIAWQLRTTTPTGKVNNSGDFS